MFKAAMSTVTEFILPIYNKARIPMKSEKKIDCMMACLQDKEWHGMPSRKVERYEDLPIRMQKTKGGESRLIRSEQ